MSEQQKMDLARHFGDPYGQPGGSIVSARQASSVLADPQAHVDALVEAGVLLPLLPTGRPSTSKAVWHYRVIEPHTHTFTCADCGEQISI